MVNENLKGSRGRHASANRSAWLSGGRRIASLRPDWTTLSPEMKKEEEEDFESPSIAHLKNGSMGGGLCL